MKKKTTKKRDSKKKSDTKKKIGSYKTLNGICSRLRTELTKNDFILLYAYNGVGKTRLSMAFKDMGKKKNNGKPDTLYFNAYMEDLFSWDNDLKSDTERVLQINAKSRFFDGFKELALEEKIFKFLERYTNFDFKIDYEEWKITFSYEEENHVKISRGEENLFIWCIFLAICQLTIDNADTYNWVKYIYIDDPVSSLDDNNAITVASDLAHLLKKSEGKLKIVISSHHGLFFNVMCNELRAKIFPTQKYFLHRSNSSSSYTLRCTNETPFFHHVSMLAELKEALESGKLYTHHFNVLRSILEKTATFFGYSNFSHCIVDIHDQILYSRALNLLSHGKFSVFLPKEMGNDNKALFRRILEGFLRNYSFELPKKLTTKTKKMNQA